MNSPDDVLYRLAEAVGDTEDLEGLVRPLLEILETVTGLESTYLTFVDTAAGVQKILYARNSGKLLLPEGLSVPWEDTLCKRALEEGRAYTDAVGDCWGDSGAARELGITTYLSEPVRLVDDELYGTLCGASSDKISISPHAMKLLRLFSQLISHQLERERLLDFLEAQNREYSQHAMSDPLTGIANRRALINELERMLAQAERNEMTVHVAFIDLDNFKAINDTHGHDAGDRFLLEICGKLQAGLRDSDLLARIGGDEFVVVGMARTASDDKGRDELRKRLEQLTRGNFNLGGFEIDYAGASVGVISARKNERDVQALLTRADEAMYMVKRQRKQTQAH